MCGFVGFANFNKDTSKDIHIVKEMNLKLQKQKDYKESYFSDTNINLGITAEDTKQPISIRINETTYTIVCNGQIYNKDEIKEELKELGYEFETNSNEEILLKAFIYFGSNILKRLNGVFSFVIWNSKTKELFLVRDHFGIKPLYYTIVDNTIVFASEVKAILAYPKIEVCIDKQGICELFGLRTGTYSRSWNF